MTMPFVSPVLLHERLRDLRQRNGLRLKDVSQRIDISIPYLSDLERGRTVPSYETLEKIADYYRITVQELLRGVEGYDQNGVNDNPHAGLPLGLQHLIHDPVLGADLTSDWIKTLSRIEMRGRRASSKSDYYEIYLHLRRILEH